MLPAGRPPRPGAVRMRNRRSNCLGVRKFTFLQAASDDGASSTDNDTTIGTPTFDVQCTEAGSTLTLYADGVSTGTHTCVGTEAATITVSPARVTGTYDFTVTETDDSGNGVRQ